MLCGRGSFRNRLKLPLPQHTPQPSPQELQSTSYSPPLRCANGLIVRSASRPKTNSRHPLERFLGAVSPPLSSIIAKGPLQPWGPPGRAMGSALTIVLPFVRTRSTEPGHEEADDKIPPVAACRCSYVALLHSSNVIVTPFRTFDRSNARRAAIVAAAAALRPRGQQLSRRRPQPSRTSPPSVHTLLCSHLYLPYSIKARQRRCQ